MHPRSDQGNRRPIIAALADWWRNWREGTNAAAELARCDTGEMVRIAADVGVSPADLQSLARHGRHEADLLTERLIALDLDEAELARHETATLRDLQRVCTVCSSKGRCRHDLREDPDDPAWKEYCPNARALQTLQRAYADARR
jgi:hypothetical protein